MDTILESNNNMINMDYSQQHMRTDSSQCVEMPVDNNESLYPASSLLKNIGVEHVIVNSPPPPTTNDTNNTPSSSRTSSPIYLPTAYSVIRNLSTTTVRDTNDAEVSSASTPVVKNTTKKKKNSRPTTPNNNTDNNTIATSPPTPLEEDTSLDIEQTSNTNNNNDTQISLEQLYRIQNIHTKLLYTTKCWDFNYISLLSIAAIITGIGLLSSSSSNSNMIIVSGMLLSPIMNQVVSLVYGILLLDIKVVFGKMKNIILSLIYCIIIGLLICLCGTALPITQYDDWPTDEMLSRATPSSFFSGITIAFLTGMGVALTVLDDTMSKLVGVAVSASIIPPAVNSGILLILAMQNDSEWWNDFTLTFDEEVYDESTPNYSQLAVMSLLTAVNVLLVTCGATLMFRLKEVLPVEKEEFWYDLKVARKLHNCQGSIIPVSKAQGVAEL